MGVRCKLEGLTKRYTADEQPPVADVSLELHEGDWMSIEGPSGTGKSTLLYLIGGLLRPTSGKIWVGGVDITAMDDNTLTKWRKENVGFLFQETILFAALSAKENLTAALELHGKTGRAQREQLAGQYLERMGLADRVDYLPHQLSVGQRRRLIAARALICDTPLLLADEPTNDLDDAWSEVIIGMLEEKAAGGCCVVMVTHNDKWAKRARSHYTLGYGALQKIP